MASPGADVYVPRSGRQEGQLALASNLAEVLLGFLKNRDRLSDGVPIANHPENSEKWP